MLEKTSHKLLKTLYKKNFLTFDECHKICRTSDETGNPYASYLLNHGLIELHECGRSGEFNEADYDGYSITLDGAGLIYTEKRDFWMFLIPYVITTLIAFVAPFGSNEGKRTTESFFLFSTIFQTVLTSYACYELHLHINKILSLLPSFANIS